MYRKYLFITVLLLAGFSAQAQLKLPDSFADLLETGELIFNTPLENRYKRTRWFSQQVVPCDFAIKKRKGDMEIRYLIRPDDGKNPLMTIPHARAMATLSSVATNDQEAVIAVHRIDSLLLRKRFDADWGVVGYFQPKRSFSGKKNGKMMSLYREGKAQIFIFFLFNEPSEALEREAYTLHF